MTGAYYNEHDKAAAEWLRILILMGHIAPGDVDERSIEDVSPDDLRGYAQCHFFAGVGVWSAALRAAGWGDDRPVWTGSCPCQPFSAAGQGAGFADERHLWPAWQWLIGQRRPGVVLGEQVASKDGLNWFDLVSTDLEGAGYAVGADDLCAAGVGAPHIRQRLFFAGALQHAAGDGWFERRPESGGRRAIGCGGATNQPLAHAAAERLSARPHQPARGPTTEEPERRSGGGLLVDAAGEQAGLSRRARLPGSAAGGLGDDGGAGLPLRQRQAVGGTGRWPEGGTAAEPGPTSGAWADPDWIPCRDGKWRPVESGTFPLAHGVAGRVGLLRGYGNAIVLPLAQAFIEEVMTCL